MLLFRSPDETEEQNDELRKRMGENKIFGTKKTIRELLNMGLDIKYATFFISKFSN